jgi:hypothetical protein
LSGGEFLSEGRTTLDFIVQTGVLVGMGGAFAGFLYRQFNQKLHKTISEKVAPVEQKVDTMLAKVDDLKMETIKGIQVKEELDRERFRNIHNGQTDIKDQLHKSILNTEENKKKLDIHLIESATFKGKTEAKISGIENALSNFRSFMRHNEEKSTNNFTS